MKQDLYDVLKDASPRDIDLLWGGIPTEEPDAETAHRIRERAMEKAGLTGQTVRHRRRIPWPLTAAACLALVVGLAFGTRAYAAEAEEYRAAVAFFQENALLSEGLTRGEMKSVYRDIVTETFALSETLEVIERSLRTDRIESFDIFQTEPDSADVEALWNYRNAIVLSEGSKGWYRPGTANIRYEIELSPGNFFRFAILHRYKGNKKVWSRQFTDFGDDIRCLPLEDGVLVWGTTPDRQNVDGILVDHSTRFAYLAKLGADGRRLWQIRLENGQPIERACAAADNGDGTYALFTVAETVPDGAGIYLTQVDGSGQILSSQKVCETSVFSNVDQAVKMGGGYLLSAFIPDESGRTPLAKVTGDGELTAVQAFQAEGKSYLVNHILEYGGRAYLSAWAIPAGEESSPYAVLDQRIRAYQSGNGMADVPKDTLTEMAREYFSAALLVLDGDGGTPRELYAIRGSAGWELTVNDAGELAWDVERIDSARLEEAGERSISGDSVLCATRVFRYTFGPDGLLLRQEDTHMQSGFSVMLEAHEK